MATIDDIGVPLQPLNSPPLTEWQAAVRDWLHQHDPGGVMTFSTAVPSSPTASTELTQTGAAGWGGVTTVGNTLVIPTAGRWKIGFAAVYGSSAAGTVRALWLAEASAITALQQCADATSPIENTTGLGIPLSAAALPPLAAGTQIRALARQDSGGALTLTGHLYAYRIH